ncbi:arylsulfatase [Compostibacter hankyongensis]|uniref:Arylsulfatase n=1 Tax=Compostibacter hankyongensis TaxID=1007089 RepID=A0ABP8G1S8_9BACT
MKKRRYGIFIAGGIAALLAATLSIQAVMQKDADKKDDRPNIVIILADDMGFSDPGCYGGEIHTPNIDYLAKNGMRFTRFYNTSRCCPTRASLLTGLYNQQAGIGQMTMDRHEPAYRGYLTENTVTLAEVLKTAGYQTAMAGKWHVSNTIEQPTKQQQLDWLNHQADHPAFSPLNQYPVNRGFEKFYGTIWGVVDYFDPFSLVNGTTPVKTIPKDYYHTDAINDTAAAYIRQMSRKEKPFFLYVAENAPHWPLMAKPEDIAKYKDTYKVGWDAIREARYKRMVQMGLIDPSKAPLSPRWHNGLKWENNPDTIWDAHAMAVHAAMVDRMDQGIGRIIAALRETGQLDNTLILFLSDNGASPEICANFGPGFDRPGETRDGRKIVYATHKQAPAGPETTYSSIGPRWANVANTPYQFWKAESYEGGIHAPLIAFWPEGITAKKGSLTGQVGHVMDFMATVVELAHAHYPARYNGHDITPMQGISLVPVFKGQQRQGHTALYNEHAGGRYVRYAGWKLVSRDRDTTWHLYRIEDDETELNDLSGQYPGKVHMMDSLWRTWAARVHVFPKPH